MPLVKHHLPLRTPLRRQSEYVLTSWILLQASFSFPTHDRFLSVYSAQLLLVFHSGTIVFTFHDRYPS